MQYREGEWQKEPTVWKLYPREIKTTYATLGVPLSGTHEILFTQLQGVPVSTDYLLPKCLLLDNVSQDVVPLYPLPLRVEFGTMSTLITAKCEMLNRDTLLVLYPHTTLLLDIDTALLSPESHTSMEGVSQWCEAERENV
ncbi:hypothetical protein KIPB_003564 [Kipferlia bialata]|uniref:Uncharacterized protein n=1 Tax=Kipferlia bialata TaxID=797122 RepID=A0A391NK40_9EUKA|nr:hypothetical protein KIPB_003564 [Kipferlia bialata]|eukprot:g3564.t1